MTGGFDRRQLLEAMARHRLSLLRAVNGLSEEQMRQPGAAGELSAAEVLAHLASWEEEAAQRLSLLGQGRGDEIIWYDEPSMHDRNARVRAETAGIGGAAALARLNAAREALLRALEATTDRHLAASAVPVEEWVPSNSYLHDQEHTEELLAWRHRQGI